ncbi:MAG: dihydropteroate synthase [Bacteroidetes bacterium]|nr:dihydropteroate synthase [Bacteroidota bacterium]
MARPAHVMGILNVTPDSFSDGGDFINIDRAVARASEMISEGAAIIDVGGASSRPKGKDYGDGASVVALSDEINRVVPVIRAISRRHPDIWISIDTFRTQVAIEALKAGAHIINDITGLRVDPALANLAAAEDAPLVLMHSVGQPGSMPHAAEYEDVVLDVRTSLLESISIAGDRGAKQLILDPGFGFGKSVDDNLRLISTINELAELGFPVMVGVSRKSSIGAILGSSDEPVSIENRIFGSLGVTAVAFLRGARIIRTHDVGPTVEMLRAMTATLNA